jgi:beta-glucosidase
MLTLDRRSMWFYDPLVKDWAAEPGAFEIFIGSSSRDIRLRGKFDLYE